MILSGVSPVLWVLGILAIVAYAVPALLRTLGAQGVRSALLAAWLLHGALLALGLLGWQSGGPRFGFGPAVSMTAWLVLSVYALESRLYPQLQSRKTLAGLGGAAVLLGLLFPGAVLNARDSLWLPLHWALGIASYGLFAAAVVHAWLMTRAEAQMRLGASGGDSSQVGIPLMTLERLMFAFVVAGFVLLSGTLLAGLLFIESLYGPGVAWRWNHKTIFSVLSWLTFALLLWGRWQWGWRGKRAVRVLYTGAGLLLLAYVGSRFVLEMILRRTP